VTKPGTSFLVNFVMASALLYVFRAVLWPFALALVLAILIIALSDRVVRLRSGRIDTTQPGAARARSA